MDGSIYIPSVYTGLNVTFVVLERLLNELKVIMCRETLCVILQQRNEIASFCLSQK